MSTEGGRYTLAFWEHALQGTLTEEMQQRMAAALTPLSVFPGEELKLITAFSASKMRADDIYRDFYLAKVKPAAVPSYTYGSYDRWPAPVPPQAQKELVENAMQPLLRSMTVFGASNQGVGDGMLFLLVVPIK